MMTTLQTPTLTERNSSVVRARNLKLIEQHIAFYAEEIEMHPVGRLLAEGKLSGAVLRECAGLLFRTSVLWMPLLSLLKDRVRNENLKKFLLDYLLRESGAQGTSNVELCSRLLRTVEASFSSPSAISVDLPSASLDDVVFVAQLEEPELIGWLLAAGSLTPVTHKLLLEGFRQLEEIDCSFLEEHVNAHNEDQSQSMNEAITTFLEQEKGIERILAGIQIAARTELALLDSIFAKNLRSKSILVTKSA